MEPPYVHQHGWQKQIGFFINRVFCVPHRGHGAVTAQDIVTNRVQPMDKHRIAEILRIDNADRAVNKAFIVNVVAGIFGRDNQGRPFFLLFGREKAP